MEIILGTLGTLEPLGTLGPAFLLVPAFHVIRHQASY